nr:MAG TPA: hypothetical protein [Caudoviricetes sp.]
MVIACSLLTSLLAIYWLRCLNSLASSVLLDFFCFLLNLL